MSFVLAAALAAVLVPDDGRSLLVVGIVAGGYLLTALAYGAVVLRARWTCSCARAPVGR